MHDTCMGSKYMPQHAWNGECHRMHDTCMGMGNVIADGYMRNVWIHVTIACNMHDTCVGMKWTQLLIKDKGKKFFLYISRLAVIIMFPWQHLTWVSVKTPEGPCNWSKVTWPQSWAPVKEHFQPHLPILTCNGPQTCLHGSPHYSYNYFIMTMIRTGERKLCLEYRKLNRRYISNSPRLDS